MPEINKTHEIMRKNSSIWITNFTQDYTCQKDARFQKIKHNKAMVKKI